ncbi:MULTISPECIES: S41 family peptidase [unclassified Paenibacillus]|uniref:S41 family peptidase n=1 Tax=unclassified Paenibacillus TaxID=185978 RepID=UPI0030FCBDBC
MQKTIHSNRATVCSSLILLLALTGCNGGNSGNPDGAAAYSDSGSGSGTAAAEVAAAPSAVPATALSAESTLTKEQKHEDFEYMYKILQENYPFFEVNKRANGVDWLADKDKYLEKVEGTPTDLQFYGALNEILADLHNGHTYMLEREMYHYYRQIFDGNPVYKPWSDILEQKQVKARYGAAEAAATPEESSSGSQAELTQSLNLFHRILEPGKSAYLQVESFGTEYTEQDGPAIADFLTKIKDYPTLILDIRGNGGGDQWYWMSNIVAKLTDKKLPYKEYLLFRGGDYEQPFLASRGFGEVPVKGLEQEKLPKLPPEAMTDFKSYFVNTYDITPDPVGFKGEIYLLVDRNVYSSSESFATFAKSTGFATLVGEKTGGDGIGATPLIAALPNSGFVLNFPVVLGLTADGSPNDEFKTLPDAVVNAEKNREWHKDEAIQKALELAASRQ